MRKANLTSKEVTAAKVGQALKSTDTMIEMSRVGHCKINANSFTIEKIMEQFNLPAECFEVNELANDNEAFFRPADNIIDVLADIFEGEE